MAYFNKVGLLVLNEDQTKFLVCEPANAFHNGIKMLIMPGGQIEAGESDIECVMRETKEELSAKIDPSSLAFIGEYVDVSASNPNHDVSIKLYQGKLLDEPKASEEIQALFWIGKEDISNEKVSLIIRNKIIPDLEAKKIIK
jgi:8-oxo-dGTP diphosphatase